MPAGPINSVSQVFADPQVLARGLRLDIANKRAKGGTTPGLRGAIIIDGLAAVAPLPAPALGEHTAEVLADANWGG